MIFILLQLLIKKFGYVNSNNVFEFIQSIRNKCEDKLFNYLLLNDSNTWVDEIWLKARR